MNRFLINTFEKAWIDYSMDWLANHLGIDRFNDAEMVLPRFDPTTCTYSIEKLQDLKFAFFAQLGFEADELELSIEEFSDPEQTYVLSHAPARLTIAADLLDDHQDLIATLLQALSQYFIQHQCGSEVDSFLPDSDHRSWLSDLLPVYVGWGIFGANTALSAKNVTSGTWESWRVSKHRHLPSRLYGYVLALFAWGHNEHAPQWASLLRPDAKKAFQHSMTYLTRTNDSTFRPQGFCTWQFRTIEEFQHLLIHGSDSAKLAAMWEIQTLDRRVEHRDGVSRKTALGCIRQFTDLTYSKDEFVRIEALNCLGLLGKDAQAISEQIVRSLSDTSNAVRAAAVLVLGQLHQRHESDTNYLSEFLRDNSDEVVLAATRALTNFLPADDYVLENILAGLAKAMINCNFQLVEMLGRLLTQSTPQAEERVERHFRNDPELLEQARSVVLPIDDPRNAADRAIHVGSKPVTLKEEHENWF